MKQAYHHGNLKNALIQDSIIHLTEVGLEGFSLRKVAMATGVTPSAVYAHYKDKHALLSAVGRSAYSRFYSTLEKAISDLGDKATHSDFKKAYVNFALDNPTVYNLLYSAYFSPKNDEETREISKKFIDLQKSLLIKAGLANQDNADRLSIYGWTRLHGFANLVLTNNLPLVDSKDHNAVLDALMDTSLANLIN